MKTHRLRPALVGLLLGAVLTTSVSTLGLGPSSAHAHQGHTDRAPWEACAEKALDDACEWTDRSHARYIGTCREIADALMCVRNRPIVPADAPDGSGRPPPVFEGSD